MKHEAWSAVARHPATAWAPLGAYAQLVALRLVVHLDCNDGPAPGRIEDIVTLIMRGTIRGRERENFRLAIRKARDAGLIFEHEGQVYVLYSETQWRRYRALGEQVANAASAPVAPPEPPTPVAPEQQVAKAPVAVLAKSPSNTNTVTANVASVVGDAPPRLQLVEPLPAYRSRTASVPLPYHNRTGQLELSIGNHSGQVPGERERERERETASPLREIETASLSDATPSALRPIASLPELKKTGKRTRKLAPFDLCREQLAALFGTHYEAAYPGRRSLPRRQDVWTTVTKAYQLPDGALNTSAAEQSIRAFLAAPWWVGEGKPGHSFDGWANNHERYDAPQQTRSATHWEVNYAH